MKKNNITVAIDIDGVLANFYKAAKEICINNNLPWEDKEECDVSDPKFWKLIRGHSFWQNLELYPHSEDLVKTVKEYTDNYFFLTKASLDPKCPEGKILWMTKYFPKELDRLWIVRGTKAFASSPRSMLIDDREKNRKEWEAAGGLAFRWSETYTQEKTAERISDLKYVFSKL